MNKDIKSLYIHIPFCNKICDYCDFTKLQYFRNFALDYLGALKRELNTYDLTGLKTIYVGGGTPTALVDDLFEELLVNLSIYRVGVEEYTFEANPESLTETKIKMLAKFGVNRVSIGVQTTNDKILHSLNRDHTFEQVKKAVRTLKEYKIDNINVDLILGLPHASKQILRQDLENILSLDVKHISCYGLTVSPHTVLYNKGFDQPGGDELREYYDIVEEVLTKNGFIHYEVSNWAKPGYESQHNLTYWRNEQYYGAGLGASGYIGETRYKNTVNLSQYVQRAHNNELQKVSEIETINKTDKRTYQIMLNLRTIEGLDASFVEDKQKEIEEFLSSGLLIKKDNKLIPTYEGMMILDQIILKLI